MPGHWYIKDRRSAVFHVKHTTLGIALKLGATLVFSLMYVLIRLAGDVPVGEVVFFRGFFALAPLLAYAYFTRGLAAALVTARPWRHLRRSVAGTSSMFLNFFAVTRLPLADVTAFGFVMPIFAVVLAALMLHEKVGPHRAAAVVMGFGGVLLMIEPHGAFGTSLLGSSTVGATAALLGALLSAFVVVFIRQMSATETSEAIIFYFMIVCAATGAATMLWSFAPLDAFQTATLVLCGVLGGIGQLFMTYSYRYAEPSLLAPFDYAAMVWAIALGYLVFAEVPERIVLAGAGVVRSSRASTSSGASGGCGWRRRRACCDPSSPLRGGGKRIELFDQSLAEIVFQLSARALVEGRAAAGAGEAAVDGLARSAEAAIVEGDREQRAHHGLERVVVDALLQAPGMDQAAAARRCDGRRNGCRACGCAGSGRKGTRHPRAPRR